MERRYESAARARDVAFGVVADDADLLYGGSIERQEVVFVLQQHDTLGSRAVCHLAVLGIVESDGLVGIDVFIEMEIVDGAQDVEHLLVQFFFLQFALEDILLHVGELYLIVAGGGSLVVHAVVEEVEDMIVVPSATLCVVRSSPVADGHKRVVPLLAQDVLHQHAVLAAIHSVDEVVARHDGAHLGVLRRVAEGRQVDLLQGTFVNIGAGVEATILHEVDGEVLHHAYHARVALHALDIAARHLRGEPRVFAHILEVAAIARRAIDIHARAKDKLYATGTAVASQCASIIVGQALVPCRCQHHVCGIGSALLVSAHSLRAVAHKESGQSDAVDGAGVERVLSHYQIYLVGERHLLQCHACLAVGIVGEVLRVLIDGHSARVLAVGRGKGNDG